MRTILKTPSPVQIEVSVSNFFNLLLNHFDLAAKSTYPNNNIQHPKNNLINGNMKHRTGDYTYSHPALFTVQSTSTEHKAAPNRILIRYITIIHPVYLNQKINKQKTA